MTHRTPYELRLSCREGVFSGPTFESAPGILQANLVIVPTTFANDFEVFCRLNPKPCPLLEVTKPGGYELQKLAQDVDLRTDLPKYRVFQNGSFVAEPTDILSWWRDDLVAFLLGCSLSFEHAMLTSGLPVRHVEEHRNGPVYRTNIPCQTAGSFHGPTVVSMRPIPSGLVDRAIQLTEKYPFAHGAPLHVGDPSTIGIKDLQSPDFGEAVTIHADETPVFWACGVTPQVVLLESKTEFAITHSPGHMFVTDIRSDEFVWDRAERDAPADADKPSH